MPTPQAPGAPAPSNPIFPLTPAQIRVLLGR